MEDFYMKRMINKIVLSLLLLSCGTQTVHAGLSQMTKSAAHSVLKTVGDNPGWLAFAGMIVATYDHLLRMESRRYEREIDEADTAWRLAKASTVIGLSAIALSAACKWWASKF